MCWLSKLFYFDCKKRDNCILYCCGNSCIHIKTKNNLSEEIEMIDIDRYWENMKTLDDFLELESFSQDSDEDFPLSI